MSRRKSSAREYRNEKFRRKPRNNLELFTRHENKNVMRDTLSIFILKVQINCSNRESTTTTKRIISLLLHSSNTIIDILDTVTNARDVLYTTTNGSKFRTKPPVDAFESSEYLKEHLVTQDMTTKYTEVRSHALEL
jgi:hypothetical protein